MRAVDVIRAKRDGQALSPEAIAGFIRGVVDGSWPDYQVSALLMAIVLRGMSAGETAELTRAMLASGDRVDLSSLPGAKVGKHSTGGVGDKVSLILAPLVAACGVVVPKMSGRALGHTGGTLDKLESIPGLRTDLTLDEFRGALADVGCAIIGQTAQIVPADRVLYSLRDATATIDSLPLIAASIMSKKLAEGSTALVLDVKCGRGAFMRTPDQAMDLARALVALGAAHGVRTEAVISRMDAPLGRAVGNALEVMEAIETLGGKGPATLADLVTRLAARMVVLGGRAGTEGDADACVRAALASGAALERFAAMVARQGGDPGVVDDPRRLPQARRRLTVTAPRSGFVRAIDAGDIGRASMCLGAGRERPGAPIDHAAGVVLAAEPGAPVTAGAPLLDLHYDDEAGLDEARRLAAGAVEIGDAPLPAHPVVLDWLHA